MRFSLLWILSLACLPLSAQLPYHRFGAIGMNYSQESWADALSWDSLGRYQNRGGFDVHFMGRNRATDKGFGLYVGGEFGVHFYGNTQRENVALNTQRQDSAFTYLSAEMLHFQVNLRTEKAIGPVLAFAAVTPGVKLMTSTQHVQAYLPLVETVSSSSNNTHSSAAAYLALETGLRWRLNSWFSLQGSYWSSQGSNLGLLDLSQSPFNGLRFDAPVWRVATHQQGFKVGMVFDLSTSSPYSATSPSSERVEVIRYMPCPCCPKDSQSASPNLTPAPVPKTNDILLEPSSGNEDEPSERRPSRSSGSVPAPVQKPFPGISPPPVKKP